MFTPLLVRTITGRSGKGGSPGTTLGVAGLLGAFGGGPFQMFLDSHSTRSKVGDILRLGQKTRSKFPRGIFVSLLRSAVAWMSSTTVYNKSRFSAGSNAISTARASREASEVARNPAKLGSARVERDGGLRNAKPDGMPPFGPAGSDGFLAPRPNFGATRLLVLASSTPSDAKADSK